MITIYKYFFIIHILPFEIFNFSSFFSFSCPVLGINITVADNTQSRSYGYIMRHASITTIVGLFTYTVLYLCCNKSTMLEHSSKQLDWEVTAKHFIRDARYMKKKEIRKIFSAKILTLNQQPINRLYRCLLIL